MSLIDRDSIRLIVEKSFRSHGFSGTQGTADYEMAWKRNLLLNPGSDYQQNVELKVNLQDFRDVIADSIFTILTDKFVTGTLSSGNTKGEQSISSVNDNFNINEVIYINGIGTSAQTYIVGDTTNINPTTLNINPTTTNINSNYVNIAGVMNNILGTNIGIVGNYVDINNPTSTQFAARNGDSVLCDSSTDLDFIAWMSGITTAVNVNQPIGKKLTTPISVSSMIASGSSNVRIGG